MADAPRTKRFTHQSYAKSLKEVHLPSALSQTPLDNDLQDHESHFYTSLEHWQQLNLAPSFIKFAHRVGPLSGSMPLLLHNWQEIIQLWVAALDDSDDEGLLAVLDLLQKITHDLRRTLSPVFLDPILPRLLALLHRSRSISAPALTALTATFDALFKFLLIPASTSSELGLLETTWNAIRETLPKCLPEVQRSMAEVWGRVLRTLKPEARERAVTMLAESVVSEDEAEVQDAVAWSVGSACKSVADTLHTSTPSIITPLLDYHLSAPTDQTPKTYNLLRRLLTALIHYVKGYPNFVPLGDVIVDRFLSLAQGTTTTNSPYEHMETLRRMMDIMSVVAAVRKGSLLTQKQATALLTPFPAVLTLSLASPDPSPLLIPALLRLATALLTALPEENRSFWMTKGREVLDTVWTATSEKTILFAISLTGALAELGWGGWRALGVPIVLRMSSRILMNDEGEGREELQRRTFGLIAELWRTGKLVSKDGDVVWRNAVETWGVRKLKELKQCVHLFGWEQATELTNILALSSNFSPSSGISSALGDLCDAILANPNSTVAGPGQSWFLGTCLRTLSQRPVAEWDSMDLVTWVRACTAGESIWSSSADILEALAALLAARETSGIAIEEIYPALAASVLSHSRALRGRKRCLAGEEVSVDVHGARERVLRIGRMETVVKDKQRETDFGPDLCIRWLVNLSPLWSPAAGALAQLAQRFGDEVWTLVFQELQAVYSDAPPAETSEPPDVDMEGSSDATQDPSESEYTWKAPSAHHLRKTVSKWLSTHREKEQLVKAQPKGDRLDSQSYESQLLFALGECPALVQKHNRDIVPFFLNLATPSVDPSSKLSRHKLTTWLTLFSKLSNPRALHLTDALHDLYIANLSHPDRPLQSIALSCLLTYKSPRLSAYEPKMRAFLDDTRWRDELMRFEFEHIQAQDRAEVVDAVIRLLYGVMMRDKKGRSQRAAIRELGLVVDLMLGSFKSDRTARQQQHPFAVCDVPADASEKQQIGFIGLLGEVVRNLGPRLVAYWPALLGTTMDLIARAQARITATGRADDHAEADGDDEDEDIEDNPTVSASKTLRKIRLHGIKRIVEFLRCPVHFDYAPYMQAAFPAFISPRLPSLDTENTQAPSALLELFYVCALDAERVTFLEQYDQRVLPKVFDCLIAPNVKPAVVSKIFDITDKLLALSIENTNVQEKVVQPHVSRLLDNLAILVERTKGTASVSSPLGQRQIYILSQVAQYSTNASQAATLLALFAPLLRKPHKVVPEKVKVDLLNIIGTLMALVPDLSVPGSETHVKTFELVSQLFQSLRSRLARTSLVAALRSFSLLDTSLERLAELLGSLNAYSTRRIDEPDFDRRLSAFATLNETLYKSLSQSEWLAILYHMLHAIQDPEELVIRNNAALTMRHFIDLVADSSLPTHTEYETMFTRVLYPGMKNGLRSKNELVRSEILGVFAYAVAKCEQIGFLQEMRVLLAGGDDEANFFNNIHHIQIHRRSRALRRLGDHCDEGHLRSNTLAEIFVPLVSNYVTATSSVDHHLVNDAILATGRMAKHLAWGAYYALVQKYLRLSKAKDESERVYIRTLVALLDSFHFPMEETLVVEEEAEEGDGEEEEEKEPVTKPVQRSIRIADAVNLRLLPTLLNHLEKHDPNTDDITRIPIASGIVKVAQHLPATTREPQISRLLTVLSQILRSKSQETRDLVRDTLARIAVSLGPSYLPLMLREMRAALLRGPQLHVLAYVTHSLLVHVTSDEHSEIFGNLDDSVNDVAYVSAEVIFGESAKDVLADEFKTKMREVRASSSKGLDSFGIIAKYITPARISSLLVPVRGIMQQTGSVKVLQLVDEVLKRVTSGLNANKHLVPTELLALCHTLISQNARFLNQKPVRRKGRATGDAIVQTKRQEAVETDHYANNSFRFVTFGLDLFNTALRRSKLDFHDAEIIKRLESMVVVIGNTLYSTTSPVLVFGLRAAAGITKCPLKSLEESVPVFVKQTMNIIKQAGSTESEVVQVALKSLAAILRDGPAVQVKEKDLVYLLELIAPDLEEVTRQASVFAMLRGIVARKFVVPEIYDVMDKVSDIMVTSQSPQVQELCRNVLLQFLLDYPQGKGRLRNQMNFLAKNLSYEYESGRKSVLELLGAVLAKFEAGLVREYVDLLFIALVMVIANDDSTKCREMAAQLIKTLFKRLDDERRTVIISHVHSWAAQSAQPQLTRVSSQIYGFIVDVLGADALPFIPGILQDVQASLSRSSQQLTDAENEEDAMDVDVEWQLSYHSLIVLSKVVRVFPALVTDFAKVKWDLVVAHLLFPHSWVRTAACRLLGTLFTAVPPAPPQEIVDSSPVHGSRMRDVATKLCTQIKSPHLDEALNLQVVKNLFYIGKCFYAAGPSEEEVDAEADLEDVEDSQDPNPLPWLFSKLSYQIRSAHIARRNRASGAPNWSQQPLAALRWFAAMASYMDGPRLEKFLVHILTPAYRIVEDDTIRDTQMDELKTICIELQELVQSKVGTTKFSGVYNQIRQGVLGVQRDRKAKQVLQATTNPEAAAKRRLQRNSNKKESRKRKSSTLADGRGRFKRRREEE
ncbi:armadillo-type protein [Roridomyces roridus]|uniref:Armadillo-type protein n=1 Tax=Roridomyces roridus TaxID=1738132 RepID=A0AAD7G223_9AGAR|nr:armadillo-type protein [Roridomyces roridus]